MVRKKHAGDIVFDVVAALILLLIFIVMVYPFLYVVNFSISSLSETGGSLLLLPKKITFSAYEVLLKDDAVLSAFFISAARSIVGPLLMVAVTGMAAYALATPDLVFGRFFRTAFVLTMYVSAGVVPTYIFIKQYGLMNNFLVYILPSLCSAFNLILIKTYIEGIPRSLQEAVYVDGGSDLDAYWRVIFPICRPVNAAVLLFGILSQWNNFMDTQLYCAMEEKLYTLQYVLYNTLAAQTNIEALKAGGAMASSGQTIKMAITVITVVPVMCIYPFLQKHFVSGIMIGSVKA
ncbi:MAG: carbohydrate ABC transporter permease [Oscillospiraceae bacterium]|nr:carbohydrate ABC transporter permease [Oscillospiraceae bacterium]